MTTIKKRFGLLGRNINYSFSRGYFTEKFEKENLEGYTYENFDIPSIASFLDLLKNNDHLSGMNVTIPYKEEVLPFLDKLSKKAQKIGAVNTIKFTKKGKLKGYNTDYYGFQKSLEPLLESHHKKALIEYQFVSRQASETTLGYNQITDLIFEEYQIIINSTPVGTSPNTEAYPEIPYEFFTKKHI
ncbi:MAG: shikimate dehydrogenase, partial [Bacteroidota bacterium]